jgi:hypothetical protein
MQKFDEKMPSFHCTWWTFEIMQKLYMGAIIIHEECYGLFLNNLHVGCVKQ